MQLVERKADGPEFAHQRIKTDRFQSIDPSSPNATFWEKGILKNKISSKNISLNQISTQMSKVVVL